MSEICCFRLWIFTASNVNVKRGLDNFAGPEKTLPPKLSCVSSQRRMRTTGLLQDPLRLEEVTGGSPLIFKKLCFLCT